MKQLILKYNNVNFKKYKKTIKKNEDEIKQIKTTLRNLPALKLVKNNNILNKSLKIANKFSKNKKNIIVFGTGGSNLGSRALINVMQGKQKKNILFFDNIDPIYFNNSIKEINLNNSGFIIISKSGKTPETLSQLGCLVELYKDRYNVKKLFNNSLIITENTENPLRLIGNQYRCTILDHELDIGGRYSIFSNVGMIPSIIAGVDVKKFHKGADSILKKINNNSFYNYLKLPQFFSSINNEKLLSNNVIFTYSDALYYFGKWYLQLWSESIGKKGYGITPIHAVGTTDQHSQLQLYLDGPRDKFFTFYTTQNSKLGLKINQKIMEKNNLSYLAGKKMGDLMQAEQKATLNTFKSNKIKFREIKLPKINEFYLGQIVALSIIETISTCLLLKINPFDQPAVEKGKILTKKYLS